MLIIKNKEFVLSQLATTGKGNILKENKSFQNLLSPKFSGKLLIIMSINVMRDEEKMWAFLHYVSSVNLLVNSKAFMNINLSGQVKTFN